MQFLLKYISNAARLDYVHANAAFFGHSHVVLDWLRLRGGGGKVSQSERRRAIYHVT